MARRGKGGRFVSGKKSTTRKRRATTKALVVRQPAPVVIRQSSGVPARRRRGGGSRRPSFGAGRLPLKTKGELALWGSLFGYLSVNKADLYGKIPTTGKVPREAVIGLGLHLFAKKNKHVDRASAAALSVAGYKLGEQGFKVSGWDGDDD
jgi:hypothetical protein